MIKNILLVGLAGGFGSVLRYAIQRLVQPHSAGVFPTGTFLINITGCLLIGIFWGWLARSGNVNEEIKLLLMTGFCGGFTTFSAFTLESIGLLKEDKLGLFIFYVGGSIILGLLATYAGIRFTK